MALPVILGLSALGSLIGSGLQGAGAKEQADAQSEADLANARLLQQRAMELQRQGGRQAGQIEMQASKAISGQKTQFAASGVDSSSGTAANVAVESRLFARIDALMAQRNAGLAANDANAQAEQLKNHAGASRSGGDLALAGSLIGGAGQAAGMAYNSGLFGKIK